MIIGKIITIIITVHGKYDDTTTPTLSLLPVDPPSDIVFSLLISCWKITFSTRTNNLEILRVLVLCNSLVNLIHYLLTPFAWDKNFMFQISLPLDNMVVMLMTSQRQIPQEAIHWLWGLILL